MKYLCDLKIDEWNRKMSLPLVRLEQALEEYPGPFENLELCLLHPDFAKHFHDFISQMATETTSHVKTLEENICQFGWGTWKTLSLKPYQSADSLVESLKDRGVIFEFKKDRDFGGLMYNVKYRIKTEEIELVLTTPAALGFTIKKNVSTVFSKACELGLAACPFDTAAQLLAEYPKDIIKEKSILVMSGSEIRVSEPTYVSYKNQYSDPGEYDYWDRFSTRINIIFEVSVNSCSVLNLTSLEECSYKVDLEKKLLFAKKNDHLRTDYFQKPSEEKL